MDQTIIEMGQQKRIALIAHDNKKQDLLEWAKFNLLTLKNHVLYATGTTGTILEDVLKVEINKLQSGPLGGDQQVGAMIAGGELDVVIFFFDPLESHPHDPDVKALMRIAGVWNIPMACTRSTADFVISSHLLNESYERLTPDYEGYRSRLKKNSRQKKKTDKKST